jgi:hypothetical protein
MSDERNVEVYEVEDGHDRYECMSKLLMLLPGDALLPAKGDVILAQAALPDVPRNDLDFCPPHSRGRLHVF